MKKLLLIIYIMCLTTVAWGDEVSLADASGKAAMFFTKAGNMSGAKGSLNPVDVTLAYSTPEYYIFNRADSMGFVVISAESQTREVLAYSNEGPFRVELKDKGAALFLDGYSSEIDAIRSGEAKSAAQSFVTSVDFGEGKLIPTANFAQSGDYFNSTYAPQYDSQSCVSGCVATAMAIVMNYYKWPSHGSGSHSYTTSTNGFSLSQDFSATYFDWDNMPTTSYLTTDQSNAVSELQRACGISVDVDYGTYGSSAYFCALVNALRNYFYYDHCGTITRSLYTDDKWKKTIKREIDEDRLVMVSGNSSAGGHTFVADGYDAEGNFHFNLGWEGYNNGYYSDGAISVYSLTLDAALIGIEPRSEDVAFDCSPLTDEGIEIYNSGFIPSSYSGTINKGKNYIVCTTNLTCNDESFHGYVSVALFGADGTFKKLVGSSTLRSVSMQRSSYYQQYNTSFNIPSSVNLQPNDRLWMVTSTDRGATWQKVIGASYCISSRAVSEPTESDVYGIMDYYLGKEPSSFNEVKCDVNGDGKVTMSDANTITNWLEEKSDD